MVPATVVWDVSLAFLVGGSAVEGVWSKLETRRCRGHPSPDSVERRQNLAQALDRDVGGMG